MEKETAQKGSGGQKLKNIKIMDNTHE